MLKLKKQTNKQKELSSAQVQDFAVRIEPHYVILSQFQVCQYRWQWCK